MKMFTDIIALESFTMSLDEDFWIAFCPRRKYNRVNDFAVILLHPEIKAVVIGEETVEIKEFRDQFSNVRHIIPRC